MNHAQAMIVAASLPPRLARRPAPVAPAAPPSRREALELRDLLEANLQALRALHREHRQMIHASLRALDGEPRDLRDAVLAIGSRGAPWVQAMEQTRALLFVALRELIVGDNEAELSLAMPRQA
ncbi:MAG TPA: hypothetical protein VFP84_29970 [Kofleriaceae bacterium]|nr:hypothetical protein [Kofleriaceae bacterium]